MKPPWEWNEAEILSLVSDQVQENLNLDYKACAALVRTADAKKLELTKDVSAFANSAGGTLVYGVHEKDNLPTGLDVGYDPRDISREWIENVINSGVQQRIDGVRIKQVQLTASPGKVLYVVHVPQSMRAPHMASDKRFYKRFNFASVPMEEYEVRDVGRRSETPDLRIELRVSKPIFPIVEVWPYITNRATQPATHAIVRVFVDASLEVIDYPGLRRSPDLEMVTVGIAQKRMHVFLLAWAAPPNLPIWENELLPLTGNIVRLGYPRGEDTRVIGWRITSPRMSPNVGFYGLAECPNGLEFGPLP